MFPPTSPMDLPDLLHPLIDYAGDCIGSGTHVSLPDKGYQPAMSLILPKGSNVTNVKPDKPVGQPTSFVYDCADNVIVHSNFDFGIEFDLEIPHSAEVDLYTAMGYAMGPVNHYRTELTKCSGDKVPHELEVTHAVH